MKNFIKIFFAILLITSFNKSFAQSDAEQKAWMNYMTPGAMQEMLAKSNGEWTGSVSMWMDPSAPPMKMDAVCTNKMILGGRYQYSTNTGTMMGMPFEGINIIGYDNAKKVFVSSWVDNMGTGIMNLSGTYDEATKSVNLTGIQTDPMTGNDLPIREVFKIIDDNNQSMEMYMTKDGKEMKTTEILFKRK